jgi:purine-nucleoside phosphorylase
LTENFFTREDIDGTAQFIQSRSHHKPTVGLVLGSGLNPLADEITQPDSILYRDIPNFPVPTVEGHIGELVIGCLNGKTVVAMRGRVHYYEGYTMQQVTLPIRAMRALGVSTLIVTNAAGGVNKSYHPGDLMLIRDQINLVGMTGLNPLRGPNDDSLGPRFPVMSDAYDMNLRSKTRALAKELKIEFREGVYAMQAGPSFESPADVRFLQMIGADAVGMSTVPEVIVARHGGVRVLGLSLITNSLVRDHAQVNHEEVLEMSKQAVPLLATLIKCVLSAM